MKIQPVNNRKTGQVRYKLTYFHRLGGYSRHKMFDTEAEALAFYEDQEALYEKGAPSLLLGATASEMADLAAALRLAREQGRPVGDVIRKGIAPPKPPRRSKMPSTWDLVLAAFLSERRPYLRATTLQSYKASLNAVHKKHPDFFTYTQTQTQAMLARYSPATANSYQRTLAVFFKWAVGHHYREDDPTKGIAKLPEKRTDPCYYSVPQVKRILRVVMDHAPQHLGYYVIGLFSGLRPAAIRALKPEDIMLHERAIRVGWDQDKTSRKYFAPIPDNGAAWIETLTANQVYDVPRYWVKRVARLARVPLGHDIIRHTFASHAYAHFGLDWTVAALNHRDSDMLFRHYRAVVLKSSAEEYFGIEPKSYQ